MLHFIKMEKTKEGVCLRRQKSRAWGKIMMSSGEPSQHVLSWWLGVEFMEEMGTAESLAFR